MGLWGLCCFVWIGLRLGVREYTESLGERSPNPQLAV